MLHVILPSQLVETKPTFRATWKSEKLSCVRAVAYLGGGMRTKQAGIKHATSVARSRWVVHGFHVRSGLLIFVQGTEYKALFLDILFTFTYLRPVYNARGNPL